MLLSTEVDNIIIGVKIHLTPFLYIEDSNIVVVVKIHPKSSSLSTEDVNMVIAVTINLAIAIY